MFRTHLRRKSLKTIAGLTRPISVNKHNGFIRYSSYNIAPSASSPVQQIPSIQKPQRSTLSDIYQLYQNKEPITMVTAHDYITAQWAQHAQADITLVGDSLAMVALGYEDTNQIPFDEMMYHVKLVSRGNSTSFLIADLPFGSYELSLEQATQTAIKMIKYGRVQAIKIEGDKSMAPTVKRLTQLGIPVMAHVGLTPQHHNALGGFKLQGNNANRAVEIYEDCLALQEAGAFAFLLECIPNKLAQEITQAVNIPTIGIGAGPYTSGQVLVMADLLGMGNPQTTHRPKFVTLYETFFEKGVEAIKQYKQQVKLSEFPNPDHHGYKMKTEALQAVREAINSRKQSL